MTLILFIANKNLYDFFWTVSYLQIISLENLDPCIYNPNLYRVLTSHIVTFVYNVLSTNFIAVYYILITIYHCGMIKPSSAMVVPVKKYVEYEYEYEYEF